MNKLKVVNLFAGPGSGKSTTAAGVFSLLKLHGINAELSTEFCKDLVWEKRDVAMENQYYIWAKQYHKLFRLKDQVDVVIVDSPLLNSLLYGNGNISSHFYALVTTVFKQFDNMNFYINRVKPYNPKGRTQTEEEAKRIDANTKRLLQSTELSFEEVPGNLDGINHITDRIMKKHFSKKLSIYLNKKPDSGVNYEENV